MVEQLPDPRSGVDERGEWSPAFEGQRPPFEPGNELAAAHGAYREQALAPLAREIGDTLRRVLPVTPTDEPMLQLLSGVLARIEVAHGWLAERGLFRGDAGELQPVLKQLSTWKNTAARLINLLGGTPAVRAQLQLHGRGGGDGDDPVPPGLPVTATSLAAAHTLDRVSERAAS